MAKSTRGPAKMRPPGLEQMTALMTGDGVKHASLSF
jgi:hypothetical protein